MHVFGARVPQVRPAQPSPILKIGAPLSEEEAVLMLQRNERGAWVV